VENGVLTVRDNEHNVLDTVGGNEVALRKLPSLGNTRENPRGTDPVSRPYFPRGSCQNFSIFYFIYNHDICILLIKTN
jgi:hypothetical protein